MISERPVDLGKYSLAQPGLTHEHNGFELMGAFFQRPALLFGKLRHKANDNLYRWRLTLVMSKKGSSRRWLAEHQADAYVKKARGQDYRSRSVYKLAEIDKKDRLFKPGMTVIDLGAAPGGWSQYAVERLKGKGRVIALDILEMDPIAGVEFIHGDFTDEATLQALLTTVGDTRAELVISDMAPNLSGVKVTDQARAMVLAELALDAALQLLKSGGSLLVKVFQGKGIDEYRAQLRRHFEKVAVRKPDASRGRSAELYLLARNHRMV